MSITSVTAANGLRASMNRFNASAARTASAQVPGSGVDLTSEVVEQMTASVAFKANAKVLETAAETERSTFLRWA